MKRQAKKTSHSDATNDRKLRLKRETVRVLSGTELSEVAGGRGQTTFNCPTSHQQFE